MTSSSNTTSSESMNSLQAASPESVIASQATAAIRGSIPSNEIPQDDSTASSGQNASSTSLQPVDSVETDIPLSLYGDQPGSILGSQNGLGTKASMGTDGRVNINITQRDERLSSLIGPALQRQQSIIDQESTPPPPYIPPSLGGEHGVPPPPPLNIVIQVVGSRGDVQPFIALGKVLKETYGHRVRLATHPTFESFVHENGLEFFSIGGDPAQLMAFMVKHPGLMPDFDALRTGDIGKRRKEVAEYIKGCWRSCFETGNGRGVEVTDDSIQDWSRSAINNEDHMLTPFVADCIIANPPSFAHIHCAERMGIPLHIMFTMPYSPTQAFPHPLANIQSSNTDPRIANYVSYALIEMLTWQGLGDIINRFRVKSLGLEPISLVRAPTMLQRLKVPHTYCWSPALIPKPADWSHHISIAGFYFLNLATNYTPDPDLAAFLAAGPPPVYIGFGSIVLDDPNAMTELIFDAARASEQRVLLSKGWGGMGADQLNKPDNVFMLGNCPHDWLFQRVSCVVHHGGAGTTAAGISAGRPTVVVPFFGDQPFWGSMVARAGAGPEPIPNKQLTADRLAEAIRFCLQPESQSRAKELAAKIASETGTEKGAEAFHQFLEPDKLRCNLSPSRAAVWRLKRTQVRLSSFAACALAQADLLSFNDLKLFRAREYETDEGPWDPISGVTTALVGTMSSMMLGVADLPVDTLKALGIHPEVAKKKATGQSVGSDENDVKSAEPDLAASASGAQLLSGTASVSISGATTPSVASSAAPAFNLQESLDRSVTPSGRSDITARPTEGIGRQGSSSMAEALRGELGRRSRSNSRSRSSSISKLKNFDPLIETALGTGRGVGRIIEAGLSSPIDFTMGLSRGFHNAPRLYGDDTVRKHDQVVDFKSGIKAAGKGFGLGMYDGISGLITQPLRGAQKEGAAGFIKGIGKGIGGVALKPSAAVWSVPAYTMKGVQKEVQRHFGSSVQNYIIASRTAQGYAEWRQSSPEEKADVILRWKHMQKAIKKKRNPDEMVRAILEEQRRKHAEKFANCRLGRSRTSSMRAGSPTVASPRPSMSVEPRMSELQSSSVDSARPTIPDEDDEALKEAIRLSVIETSRGNSAEDAEIERAIQASIADMLRQRSGREMTESPEDHDLQRAIRASQADDHADLLYDEELERVLTRSLTEQRRRRDDDGEWDMRSIEDARKASADLQSPEILPSYGEASSSGGQGHLEGVTRDQFSFIGSKPEKSDQEKNEERIVMEYIQKQSMLEEEHRRAAQGKQREARNDDDDDDDDDGDIDDENLQKALKASMLEYHQGV